MKIVKEFEDKEFALSRSDAMFKYACYWYWGLSENGELYAKGHISGYQFSTWAMFLDICMGGLTLAEIKRIYENLVESKPIDKKCSCDIMVLMARGCQCGGK